MMKFSVFTVALLFSLIVYADQVAAQALAELAQCTGPDCGTCNIMYMANGLIKWLIGILFLVFAVLLMRAGINLVISGGNSSALQGAKDSFVNALVGFIIILAAWLIVDTLMRALIGSPGKEGFLKGEKTGYLFWSEVQCTKQVSPTECNEDCQESILLASQMDHGNADDSFAPGYVPPATGGTIPISTGSGANCPAASPSSVVTIPGTGHQARPEVVQRFVQMRDAARRDGITLQVTSGWRSEEKQVQLFNRLCPGGTCGATKAARPCSLGGNGSNHNAGVAIDINVGCRNGQSGCNTATYRWLKANGGRFGFYNNLPTDPLHWSPSGR
jgi:hypothetical protein